MNDEMEKLQAAKQSPWFRRVQMLQWFGLVMFVLAIGLAALTDFMARREGIVIVVLFVGCGLVAMVAARLILGAHLRHP